MEEHHQQALTNRFGLFSVMGSNGQPSRIRSSLQSSQSIAEVVVVAYNVDVQSRNVGCSKAVIVQLGVTDVEDD